MDHPYPDDRDRFARLPVKFGRYEVERSLGGGAMGSVYLARDTLLDRTVALKVPRLEIASSQSTLRRMETEAKALARIDHPHICKVYDFGIEEGLHYIVLEYVPGEDLKQIYQKLGRKRKLSDALLMLRQLAKALVVAHEKGVIHRDLKPENIIRRTDGRLVIMDFGLARQAVPAPDAVRTQGGTIIGNAAYMSPEQARGWIDQIDHRSDIYSLGVMFFEMLTGEWPFRGTAWEIMGRKATQSAPSPLEFNSRVPPSVVEICQKMLAADREERYADCNEILNAIRQVKLNPDAAAGFVETRNVEPSANEPAARSFEFLKESEGPTGIALEVSTPASSGSLRKELKRRWSSVPLMLKILLAGLPIVLLIGLRSVSTNVASHRVEPAKTLRTDEQTAREDAFHESAMTNAASPPAPSLPPRTIHLLDAVKLPDHIVQGLWHKTGAGLRTEAVAGSRIICPLALTGAYDATLEFTRIQVPSGGGAVGILLPVSDRTFHVGLDGWSGSVGEPATGIGRIDGKSLADLIGTAAIKRPSGLIVNSLRHRLQVQVRPDAQQVRISVSLDGTRLVSWEGQIDSLTTAAHYALPNSHLPGFLVWNAVAEVHAFDVTPVDAGRASLLGDDWRSPFLQVRDEPEDQVKSDAVEWNGRFYLLSSETMSQVEAQQFAADRQGRLLTISSNDEEEFIQSQWPGKSIWMAGWRPPFASLSFRDERNRPLKYLGRWGPNQPDHWDNVQWNLCLWTRGHVASGWHDVEPSWQNTYACIEWGEEYPAAASSGAQARK